MASHIACCAVCCAHSHFHKLPPRPQAGVALEVGIAVELLLGLVINLVVLYSTGESALVI
jgi:hypothetical protein